MNNCTVCTSSLKPDIEKMISDGANNQHIKTWAKQRNVNLTLKAIASHKVKHYGYIETVNVTDFESEPVNLTLANIEEILEVDHEELLAYLGVKNIKPHQRKKYDVIDIMRFLIEQLKSETIALENKLDKLDSTSEKETMADLKQQKLEAQTRLLTAVADLKEVTLKQTLGELIPNKKLEEQWSYSLVGFKALLESIPNKVALELSSVTNQSSVAEVLTKLISEALEELEHGSAKAV